MEAHYNMEDGSAPFGSGKTWSIHFEDLVSSYWDGSNSKFVEETLATGEWNFEIEFNESNGNFNTIEFVKEPISMKAVTGWKPDGTDVFEEVNVTSFALHSMSAVIRYDHTGALEFSKPENPMYAVMKDGSRVALYETAGNPGCTWYELEEAIDIDQADHILLPDGTRIPGPQ